MLSPENYRVLSIIVSLPGKYYPQDKRPLTITPDRQNYLVELKLLKVCTLVSKESNEPLYRNGCVGYFMTPLAEDELALYEIHANRKAEQDVKEIKEGKTAIANGFVGAAVSALDTLLNK